MNESQPIDNTQKTVAKSAVIILTLIYGILFFPVLQIAGLTGMIFDGPINPSIGYTVLLSMFAIPISILFSITSMWVNFRKGSYRRAVLWGALPVIVSIITFIIVSICGYLDPLIR